MLQPWILNGSDWLRFSYVINCALFHFISVGQESSDTHIMMHDDVARTQGKGDFFIYSYLRFDRPFPIGYSSNSLFTF